MVHVHQKPVSQAEQTSCDKPQTFLINKSKVQPFFGVKQGCPLSPLLFSIYLNGIDSVTDGAQGALIGDFTVLTCSFLITCPSLPMFMRICRPC
jgi:hypothetical protein